MSRSGRAAREGGVTGGLGAGGNANVQASQRRQHFRGDDAGERDRRRRRSIGQGGGGSGGFARVRANAGSSITVGGLTVDASRLWRSGRRRRTDLAASPEASALDRMQSDHHGLATISAMAPAAAAGGSVTAATARAGRPASSRASSSGNCRRHRDGRRRAGAGKRQLREGRNRRDGRGRIVGGRDPPRHLHGNGRIEGKGHWHRRQQHQRRWRNRQTAASSSSLSPRPDDVGVGTVTIGMPTVGGGHWRQWRGIRNGGGAGTVAWWKCCSRQRSESLRTAFIHARGQGGQGGTGAVGGAGGLGQGGRRLSMSPRARRTRQRRQLCDGLRRQRRNRLQRRRRGTAAPASAARPISRFTERSPARRSHSIARAFGGDGGTSATAIGAGGHGRLVQRVHERQFRRNRRFHRRGDRQYFRIRRRWLERRKRVRGSSSIYVGGELAAGFARIRRKASAASEPAPGAREVAVRPISTSTERSRSRLHRPPRPGVGGLGTGGGGMVSAARRRSLPRAARLPISATNCCSRPTRPAGCPVPGRRARRMVAPPSSRAAART